MELGGVKLLKFTDINMDKSILFFDNVDEYSVKEATNRLGEILDNGYKDDVYLVINSYGGYIEPMFGFVDALKAMDNKLVTVAFGVAMSAGSVLLSLGDERYMTNSTSIMIHEVSGGNYGTVSEQKDSIERAEVLQSKLFDLLSENTKMNGQELLDHVKGKNWFLNTNEALELGIITGIMNESDNTNFSKVRHTNMLQNRGVTKIQKGDLMPKGKKEDGNVDKPTNVLEVAQARVRELELTNKEIAEKYVAVKKDLKVANELRVRNEVQALVNARGITLKTEEDGTEKELENLINARNSMGLEVVDLILDGFSAREMKNQDIEKEEFSENTYSGLYNAFIKKHNRKPDHEEAMEILDKVEDK